MLKNFVLIIRGEIFSLFSGSVMFSHLTNFVGRYLPSNNNFSDSTKKQH